MLGLLKGNNQKEKVKVGSNGHKRLTLKQRLVRYLLKDARIEELHIGSHSIVITSDVVKMSALAEDPATPAEGWIWHLAGAAHKPRFHDGTVNKDIGEGAAPGAHDMGGASHTADTLANINTKVSDGDLDLTTAKRDPNAHKTTHENGGTDEMSLAGLDGEPSTLATHKDLTTGVHGAGINTLEHTGNKGAANGYMGLGAGSRGTQSPKLHATDHKSGGDDVVKLNELGAPTAAVDFSSQKATGLATPVATGDGATKGYVDSVATGLDLKASCRVATTDVLPACTAAGSGVGKTLTINAAGILTIDGVATVLGDRILVKNQVAGEDNGIYEVTTEGTGGNGNAAVLTRATDSDEDAEVTAGAYTFIEEGDTLADQGWVLTTNDPITVDTTALVFGQFSSAGGTPAHKDTHDPEDGADPLDCAAPGEIVGVAAAAEGNAHEFARANHTHQIQHSLADDHIVTVDGATNTPVNTDYAKFTASGLEGMDKSQILTDLNVADGADVTGSNAPQEHAASHQATGGDELDLTGMKADSLAEKIADAGVTIDTCLIKDGKAADSLLLENSNKATVQDHTPKAHDKGVHSDIDQSLLKADNVEFAQVTVGDLVMKNGFRFTEHPRYGVALKSPKGELYRLMLEKCQRK